MLLGDTRDQHGRTTLRLKMAKNDFLSDVTGGNGVALSECTGGRKRQKRQSGEQPSRFQRELEAKGVQPSLMFLRATSRNFATLESWRRVVCCMTTWYQRR